MTDKKNKRAAVPALGGCSLIVIFAVLCLTVFALLGLSTVQADIRLADSALEAVSDYYAADLEAERIFAAIRRGELPEEVWWDEQGNINWTCPISDSMELAVTVSRTDSSTWKVLCWQAQSATEWVADDGPSFWDGDMPIF